MHTSDNVSTDYQYDDNTQLSQRRAQSKMQASSIKKSKKQKAKRKSYRKNHPKFPANGNRFGEESELSLSEIDDEDSLPASDPTSDGGAAGD